MTQAKLMIPGPVAISDDVRRAMAAPSMPHYGQDWLQLYGETQEMLKQVFGTRHSVSFMAGPGSMALEAAMISALEPQTEVVVLTNGFFGERLVNLARANALLPIIVEAPLGQPVLPDMVEAAFTAHPQARALLLVHHETSTTVLNPLQDLAAVAHNYDALTIVDAVSSLGGVPLPVDDWGIDICVSVANKILGTPPALSFLAIRPHAWEMIEQRQAARGWYLDLKTWRWYAQNWGDWHPTPVTMPTSNMCALHQSLEHMLSRGLPSFYAAHKAAAHAVRAGLKALGFSFFVKDERYASPLTTAFCTPEEIGPTELQQFLLTEAQVMISGGIGELKGKILRVGHIGLARTRDYVIAFLLGVEDYLRAQGLDIVRGQSLVALENLDV